MLQLIQSLNNDLMIARKLNDVMDFIDFSKSKFNLVHNGQINKFLATNFIVQKDFHADQC